MRGNALRSELSLTTGIRDRWLFPLLAVLFLCIVPAGCFFPGSVEDLNVKQLESLMKKEKKLVIVDNRTELEYLSGHIPGSLNIPQQNFPTIVSFLPADKDTPLVFYCAGYS